jgi:hypothetical protein
LHAVALGRKNYLFTGSDAGAERAAAIYSVIGSAKLNGLDPEAYLCEVLARIADFRINRIEELLPWNIATSLPPASRGCAFRRAFGCSGLVAMCGQRPSSCGPLKPSLDMTKRVNIMSPRVKMLA